MTFGPTRSILRTSEDVADTAGNQLQPGTLAPRVPATRTRAPGRQSNVPAPWEQAIDPDRGLVLATEAGCEHTLSTRRRPFRIFCTRPRASSSLPVPNSVALGGFICIFLLLFGASHVQPLRQTQSERAGRHMQSVIERQRQASQHSCKSSLVASFRSACSAFCHHSPIHRISSTDLGDWASSVNMEDRAGARAGRDRQRRPGQNVGHFGLGRGRPGQTPNDHLVPAPTTPAAPRSRTQPAGTGALALAGCRCAGPAPASASVTVRMTGSLDSGAIELPNERYCHTSRPALSLFVDYSVGAWFPGLTRFNYGYVVAEVRNLDASIRLLLSQSYPRHARRVQGLLSRPVRVWWSCGVERLQAQRIRCD